MTENKNFSNDNDDFTTPNADAGSAGADDREDSPNTDENTDTGDASHFDDGRGQTSRADNAGAENDMTAGDEPVSDADLPQLLRDFSHVLRREFRAAAAESGFDPRDFGRMRRGRRRWDLDEVVADGAAYPEEPVAYGPPRGRGGRGPSKNIDPEELRQRFRDLREGVGDRIEEVLTSEEFENLKASLSKIVENFGPERCGDDSDRHDGPRDHERPHDHDEHRGGPDRHGVHGRGGGDRDHRRGGGRGFGPSFGPGFGPGRRGFDPFGWADERRSREQEVQEAFERGFAAGFEQGRNS
ncbi:hypothetical protein SAMN04489752_0768 [Brevibacterium siliguriense]|uniref:Uncharacterized protein n=1 Tax=Brevibacterium siliguriense TaxID=1136497 RepID=A0A1H1NMI2_9MICO|nr:hypothetical protein [Brevibacterium siliguriense]SDS00194.1 hypothetical protein SAMN04489752_0768 [Brevibacterium siliguriense]